MMGSDVEGGRGSTRSQVVGAVAITGDGQDVAPAQANRASYHPSAPGLILDTQSIVSGNTQIASVRPSRDHLVAATLVDTEDVVMAEPMSYVERNWKRIAIGLALLLTALVLVLSLTLTDVIRSGENQDDMAQAGVLDTTYEPTPSPTFDPRPTLEIIQSRGFLKCGKRRNAINVTVGEGFYTDLCRSVAAVLLGNPESFEEVEVTGNNRWQMLHQRKIDILAYGDTHTIEREVKEVREEAFLLLLQRDKF